MVNICKFSCVENLTSVCVEFDKCCKRQIINYENNVTDVNNNLNRLKVFQNKKDFTKKIKWVGHARIHCLGKNHVVDRHHVRNIRKKVVTVHLRRNHQNIVDDHKAHQIHRQTGINRHQNIRPDGIREKIHDLQRHIETNIDDVHPAHQAHRAGVVIQVTHRILKIHIGLLHQINCTEISHRLRMPRKFEQ